MQPIVLVYNRQPYDFEFCVDQQVTIIPAHSQMHMTADVAFQAVKQSLLMEDLADPDNTFYGVLPEGAEGFGVPLTQEDIDTRQDVPGFQYQVEDPSVMKALKVAPAPDSIPPSKRALDKNVTVVATGANR